MIRTLRRYVAEINGTEKEYVELSMDSTDTKPDAAGLINGSIINETDTGKVYMLDEDSGEWVEQFNLQDMGGGSSLPAVTSSDNGDVLTVVEGAWAKAAAPSGSFVIPLTMTYNNGWVYTNSEITIQDVIDAVDAGKNVIAICETASPYVAYYYRLDCCYRSDSSGTIVGANLTFRSCETYSANATYLTTLFTSSGASSLDSTISLNSVTQMIFNPAGDIELTESNGNYVSSQDGSAVTKNTRFWMNPQTYSQSWATNVRWFTTVSMCTDAFTNLQVIIKDELTGSLYKSEASPYATLNFQPYTPTP